MKNKIYYTFFFVLLIVAFIVGVLYKFGFPYWLHLSGFLIITNVAAYRENRTGNPRSKLMWRQSEFTDTDFLISCS